MYRRAWHTGPLGPYADQFLDRGSGTGWHRALKRFETLKSRRQVDRYLLSDAQQRSLELLEEWWDSKIDYGGVSQSMIKFVLEMAKADKPRTYFTKIRALARVAGATAVLQGKLSAYDLHMCKLFEYEFVHPDSHEPASSSFAKVNEQRMFSGFFAAAQSIAKKVALRGPSGFDSVQLIPVQTSRILRQCLPSGSAGAYVGADAKTIPEILHACEIRLGPLGACPWLELEGGHPYYLWDVRNQRTIKVDKANPPEYICVSHTWGRWRDDASEPVILRLPNGECQVPWAIPANTRFKVQDLPLQLKIAFSDGYIWFDLFCIPQDRGDTILAERANIEIMNQAQIFKGAKYVVAWMNDISSWGGLQKAIHWMGIEYLRKTTPDTFGIDLGELEEAAERCMEPAELLQSTPDPLRKAAGWFTSLWTLQEVCLRPDMVLCNKGWEVLMVDDNTVVTVEVLTALHGTISIPAAIPPQSRLRAILQREGIQSRQLMVDNALWPDGPFEVGSTLYLSGLAGLDEMSPTRLLTMSNLRECTSNRAEAIMSAIGAKDWLLPITKSRPEPSMDNLVLNLVLNLYPLAFLQECAQKIGSAFYATTARGIFDSETQKRVGTLLPFGGENESPSSICLASSVIQDHDSVQSWTINQNGSVAIGEAGILAASDDTKGSGISILFIGGTSLYDQVDKVIEVEGASEGRYRIGQSGEQVPPHDQSRSIYPTFDLSKYLKALVSPSNPRSVAICLYQDTEPPYDRTEPLGHLGIILKEVSHESDGLSHWVKVGLYNCWERSEELPETKRVDWIVD